MTDISIEDDTAIDADSSDAGGYGADICARTDDALTQTEGRSADELQPRVQWIRVLGYGVLPAFALLLALVAGYLKWQNGSARETAFARSQSVQAASESTVSMLSYQADTVDRDLTAAADRLTGQFRDSYTSLVKDVVIPGAKQKQISAVARVPAAASVSATENHAVVIVFVDQTIIIGRDAPSSTASRVKVTLDKQNGRWLISQFEPV